MQSPDLTDNRKRIYAIIAASKTNWSKAVQSDVALSQAICAATMEHGERPFKERVLIFLSGEGPVCENGRERKFASIDKGWAFCSRGRDCLCLTEHKSATIGAGRRAADAARVAAASAATLLDDDSAVARLLGIAQETPRNMAALVQRDAPLLRWVLDRSAALPEHATFAERCYVAVHGSEPGICQRGNRRKFATFMDGYDGSCETDSHCACRNEAQAATMRIHHAGLDEAERARRVTAQAETVRDRYGVDNAVLIPGVREKIIATTVERYGHEHHMHNADVAARWGDAFEQRHGARSPGAVPAFNEKRRTTNLERHGAETTMHVARDAYREQTGLENPFQHPDVLAKSKASMLERHGVERALQSPVIREAMREALVARYGAGNVMQVETIRATLQASNVDRYRRISPNQSHFSDETYEILQDKDRFLDLFAGRSLRDVAVYLGIGYDTARKYCYKLGIPLPKSSYEAAIADYLISLGVPRSDISAPNRKLIHPYEVDLFVPSRKLAIEFCGLYWHRDEIKLPRYHLTKLERVNLAGCRLLTIAEDEWVHNQDIVKRRIRHALGLSTRGAGGRSCEIQQISAAQAKAFLTAHHLQGSGPYGFVNYGGFFEGTLVGVMTFSRGRLGVGKRLPELLRFATDGRTFPGLAQRLFTRFVRDHNPKSVVSYADRRWSNGDLYRKLDFVESGATEPNYWYIDCNKIRRYHRFLFRKDKIKDLLPGSEAMTEREIMTSLGYYRFYDCGSFIFEWRG